METPSLAFGPDGVPLIRVFSGFLHFPGKRAAAQEHTHTHPEVPARGNSAVPIGPGLAQSAEEGEVRAGQM